MIHRTALTNAVLCGIAVVAVAGCGATRLSNAAHSANSTAPRGATANVAVVTSSPTTRAAPASGQVTQQINSIDNQLSIIEGQINAANTGLSTSEGDPSQ